MASNRIGRINEEIQRELSSLFRTLKDPRVQSGMVTITHVDTTSDLRYSRIYVSVLEKSLEKGRHSRSQERGGLSPARAGREPCRCATRRSCSSSRTTPSNTARTS